MLLKGLQMKTIYQQKKRKKKRLILLCTLTALFCLLLVSLLGLVYALTRRAHRNSCKRRRDYPGRSAS